MQIALENLSGLNRKFNIKVPSEQIESKVKTKLHKFATKAKIPGFRPGKVPFDIIKKKYDQSARAEVLENLIRDTYTEGLRKEKLTPVARPEITIVSSKPGEQFEYTAEFEVYPEVKLNDLSQLEVEKPLSKIEEADLSDMLEKIRKNHAEWKELPEGSRKSQEGDQLTVDFTIRVVGDDAEPKKETNIKFVLGDGQMWTDFEKPLYDVVVGTEKKYSLTIPETHIDKAISGKEAEFVTTVTKICEPILPELNNDFALKMNIKEGGIEKLKEDIRSHMERELDTVLKEKFKHSLLDKLIENNPLEIPKALVDNELKIQEQEWQRRFTSQGGDAKNIPEFPKADFEKQARKKVALGLLLSTIVSENKLKVDPAEVRKKIEELVAPYYENQEEMINKMLSEQRYVAEIESLLLEDKAVDFLTDKVQIAEKNISYQDAVARK